jgi:hypothetical protein
LERRLKEIAKREGVSLNKAALMLLKKGAGLNETRSSDTVIGSALDRFMGRWSEDDERRLIESISSCEAVDEALWK